MTCYANALLIFELKKIISAVTYHVINLIRSSTIPSPLPLSLPPFVKSFFFRLPTKPPLSTLLLSFRLLPFLRQERTNTKICNTLHHQFKKKKTYRHFFSFLSFFCHVKSFLPLPTGTPANNYVIKIIRKFFIIIINIKNSNRI